MPKVEKLVADLLTQPPGGSITNPLFLVVPSHPRQPSFFATSLKPALEQAGVLVVHLDLAATELHGVGDPLSLGIGQILAARLQTIPGNLRASLHYLARTPFEPSRVSAEDGITITEAFRQLRSTTEGQIVLLVENLSRANFSEEGRKSLHSLKGVRDRLNWSGAVSFVLVFADDSEDSFNSLLNGENAPFPGSLCYQISN